MPSGDTEADEEDPFGGAVAPSLVSPSVRCVGRAFGPEDTADSTPVVVCGPYEYAIGVDQLGRGLPEPPGGHSSGDDKTRQTGPEGPMHKETEVVG